MLMDCENLNLILIHYNHGNVGYIDIVAEHKNSNDWTTQPYSAFSSVGCF